MKVSNFQLLHYIAHHECRAEGGMTWARELDRTKTLAIVNNMRLECIEIPVGGKRK